MITVLSLFLRQKIAMNFFLKMQIALLDYSPAYDPRGPTTGVAPIRKSRLTDCGRWQLVAESRRQFYRAVGIGSANSIPNVLRTRSRRKSDCMAGMPAAPEAQVAAEKPETTESATENGDVEDNGPHDSHPLQFQWALWHDQPSKSGGWGGMLKQIATFSTVEEFWA